MPFATGTYDITTTSGVLVLLALNEPAAGLNSMIVWCFYLFAIGLTALRNDGRLTLYVGGLAIVQYGVLIAAVLALANLAFVVLGGFVFANAYGYGLSKTLIGATVLLVALLLFFYRRRVEEREPIRWREPTPAVPAPTGGVA